MKIGTGCVAVALCVGMFVAGPAVHAGEVGRSVVSNAQMDAAMVAATDRETTARSGIQALLQRPEVKEMAAGYGIDLRRAEAAVGTLEGAELQALSAQAAQVDAALTGGDRTLRVSLIAALLIVIIVILLAS